jgi:hypothetical protein
MLRMRTIGLILLLLPLSVAAYASVISLPSTAHEVLRIDSPQTPQEFFGKLNDFPHTYEFAIGQTMPFKATVFVHGSEVQATDASLIIIKEEKRGVSEVGRTKGKNEAWSEKFDSLLVESFKDGGFVESELQPGVYRLEVSSPNNDALYRLVIGDEKVSRGYFENVGVLFEVKELIGSSKFTAIRSPLIYWPLAILLILGGLYIYMYTKKLKNRSKLK